MGFSEVKVAKGTLIKAEVAFYFGAREVNALGEAAVLEGEAFEMGLGGLHGEQLAALQAQAVMEARRGKVKRP